MHDEARAEPPLVLALFGPFEARLHGRPLPPLRSQKSQWLLALLALQHGRAVPRAWLAGTLWPGSSDRQGAFNLSRNLTDLRHALGLEARRLEAPTSRTLRLDLVGADADVLIFDEAIARGDPASLERAVALRRGPLLQGCHEDWVLPERLVREEVYLEALEKLAAEARERDDTAAVHHLRRLVAADPLRDSAQRALMEALAAGGDLAAAAQVYREFHLLLHRELNAAPDPETVARYEQVRAQVRQRRVAPAAPSSAAPGPAAPLTLTAPPLRLPRPLTRLVGRGQAVQEIRARLAAERLVTLTGPGGVGKTRLAIQVAQECCGELRDGACFVDLAALTDPSLVPQAVAAALTVREQPQRPLTETVQEFLSTRELLLVIDNCEHLVHACARLVEALLSACPELRILATSRQSLGLTGEIAWRVPSLSVPPVEGGELRVENSGRVDGSTPSDRSTCSSQLSTVLEFDAVRLFIERAWSIRQTFALTEHTTASVAEICRQLDGIPLAIELAAARLKVLSADDIAARLEDRLSLLTGGTRSALPRQQTLRATMDWSYDLLSEPERCLLRRLSVFAGAFALEAVEAVCTEIQNVEVLDLLTGLVDKSLVIVEETPVLDIENSQPEPPTPTPASGYPPASRVPIHRTPNIEIRYRLLETVRQYARERLQRSGEEACVRQQHEAFYLRLAERAEAYREGPDHVARLGRLDRVMDNLRAALDSSLQNSPETALRMVAALAGYWEDRGYLTEGRQWLAAALEQAGLWRRSLASAAALDGASALALLQEDRRSAQLFLDESLSIRRELGDRAGIATSLAHLAHVTCNRDDYPAARGLYEESLAIWRELRDEAGLAAVLAGLGDVARRAGEYQAARSLQEESLAIRRALGDRYGISQSLIWLGDAVFESGDTAAARAHYEEALAIRRELGDRAGVAGVMGELAEVARHRGDYAEARRLREEGLAVWRALGCQVAVIHWLGALGHAAREQGEYQEAHRFYAESLLLRKQVGDSYTIAQSLEDYAELAAAERQWTRVTRLLGAARALRDAVDKPLRPPEQEDYDRLLTGARSALGEGAFASSWEEGRAMTLEQAIDYASQKTVLQQTH
jgi:non-specific serine/threonine protein kinase